MKFSIKKPLTTVAVQVNSERIYHEIKKYRENYKLSVSHGDLVLWAISSSLKEFRQFNSNYDDASDEAIIYDAVNIAYAVNLGKGPKYPVLENAQDKDAIGISEAIKRLVLMYIREELDGNADSSTIAVTNLSPFKSFLVNPPLYENHSATIAISSELETVEMSGKEIHPTKKFNISMSYDSRVSDCQVALLFLNTIKDKLENFK